MMTVADYQVMYTKMTVFLVEMWVRNTANYPLAAAVNVLADYLLRSTHAARPRGCG